MLVGGLLPEDIEVAILLFATSHKSAVPRLFLLFQTKEVAEAVHGIIPDSEEDTLVSRHPDHVVKLAKIGARIRQCFLFVFLVFVIIWLFRIKLQGKSTPLDCSWQN